MSTAIALVALATAAVCAVIAWSLPDAPRASFASLSATGIGLLGVAIGTVSLRRRPATFGVVRWIAYAVALAAAAQIAFGGRFELGAFLLRLGAAVGVAGLALPARDRLEPTLRTTPVRVVDLLLGSTLILAIGSEIGLRIFAWVAPSPLFERPATSVEQRIAMHALRPATMRFGFPVSPTGFYDEPFARQDDRRAVLLVGGSAGVGIVPHALHYSTVAETELPDTAIWNCAVPEIGPRGYLHLLRTVGLPLEPDRALVAVEVAEDLVLAAGFGQDEPLRDAFASWLDARNLLLLVVPERIASMLDERRTLGRDPRKEAYGTAARVSGDEAIAAAFPWTSDPALEEPTVPDEVWLAEARARAERAAQLDADAGIFRALDECRNACVAAGIPFAVVVLPAAWQVEDPLWRSIAGDLGGESRDRPQTLLRSWSTRHGTPLLDLLPLLRATPPRDHDGRRHLFHRNDGRLNARGNHLAGDALAEFLRRLRAEEGR